ncbi:MAG: magnesium chelatase family protein [Patescibacteria group bacterium]|nr:YifB family Mg chelatase-like AAA ATPase [Candidatus Saccharibacteria bacterium]MDQ5963840.1 magnesium chelatase family protein [Patescibacteria group bacterium]
MKRRAPIYTTIESGSDGLKVEVECRLSNNLPSVVIVGYANKSVDEAKERIRSAFAASETPLPRKRITINLAPADIPKTGTSFDLAIAVAIICATNTSIALPDHTAFIGELGLDGTVRPVRGIIGKILAGKKLGLTKFFVSNDNLDQALLVPDITVIPLSYLRELQMLLAGAAAVPEKSTNHTSVTALLQNTPTHPLNDVTDIIGQQVGKRAIEICAAGGHNVMLGGPPGTGKSMLASCLPALLPPMSPKEVLEATQIHSLATNNFNHIITDRPFRSPHHSASHVAITGGGTTIKPGEMSLAHRGVLLFDEFPEFDRRTIESLRQPLETRTVCVSRAKESAEYPAHFIFVATANPCPCGYYQTKKECSCTPHQINGYRRKFSGPILDRIDLYADVHEIDTSKLLQADSHNTESSIDLAKRVAKARALQATRFGSPDILNADMTNRQVKTKANLSAAAKQLLDAGAEKLGLSPRAYMRTVKVARTIADLGTSDEIKTQHVAEALQYRPHSLSA